jgi:hypothetical protein
MPRASCSVSAKPTRRRERTYLGLVNDTARVLVLVARNGVTGLLGEALLGFGLSGGSGGLGISV